MSPLATGIEIMFMGMGAVFAFLGMLVWVTNLTSSLVQRYAPETSPSTGTARTGTAAAPAGQASTATPRQLAAIRAAVAQYRARHK
jgi:oxaloacetate decarboxylase gamma subunit